MNYLYLQKPDDALTTYRELLGYTKVSFPRFGPSHKLTEQSNVTRNYADKSINNILDYVGGEGKVSYLGRFSRKADGVARSSSAQDPPRHPRRVLRSYQSSL